MHGGVAFHGEQLGDVYAAGGADAPQVVAQQVHDHQVFRPVLGAAGQLPLQGGVRLRGSSPGPGALDGPGFDLSPPDREEALRRGAENPGEGGLQVGGEGCRIELSQRPIAGEGVAGDGGRETLGEVDLIAVAFEQVGLDTLEGPAVLAPGHVGAWCIQAVEVAAGRGGRGVPKEGDQLVPPIPRPGIASAADEPGLACRMIQDQGPVVDPDRHVRGLLGIFCPGRQSLDAAAQVVGEPTDGPPAEGQAGEGRGRLPQLVAQQGEGVAGGQLHLVGVADLGDGAVRGQGDVGGGGEDVVTAGSRQGSAAIEEGGPGLVRQGLEIGGAVGPIGDLAR